MESFSSNTCICIARPALRSFSCCKLASSVFFSLIRARSIGDCAEEACEPPIEGCRRLDASGRWYAIRKSPVSTRALTYGICPREIPGSSTWKACVRMILETSQEAGFAEAHRYIRYLRYTLARQGSVVYLSFVNNGSSRRSKPFEKSSHRW